MISGALPAADRFAGFKGSVALARERGTLRFLADGSAREGGRSPMDVFARIETFDRVGLDRRMREALLLSGETPAADTEAFRGPIQPEKLNTAAQRRRELEDIKDWCVIFALPIGWVLRPLQVPDLPLRTPCLVSSLFLI